MKFLAIVVCFFVIVYFYLRITNGLRKIRRPYSKPTHSSNDDAGGFLWFGSSDADTSSHHASGHADCSHGGDHGGGGDFGGGDCGGGDGGGGGGGGD